MDWFKKAQIRLKFLSFINDPTKTNKIFEIIDLSTSMKSNEKIVKQVEDRILSENPEFKKMWEDRWMPGTPSLDELKGKPEGSLGRAYFDHLTSNNLDVVFFPKVSIDRPVNYINHRMYHCHDLWHTLLGYGTSPEGEIAVQGFGLGQLKSPIAIMLISGGLINLLDNNPEVTATTFEEASKAYEKGKSCSLLLNYPLEEMLDEPIDKVREQVFRTH